MEKSFQLLFKHVNFQELKQCICKWPYMSIDGELFLERRVVAISRVYIPVNIEIYYTYKINDV